MTWLTYCDRRSFSDPLDRLVQVFERYLFLRDLVPHVAVLAAVAANRMTGDPLWMLLVGPPSSGKTEILLSLTGLANVEEVSQFSRAGMLSGSSGEGTGGVLVKIGRQGILLFKDLTTLLSETSDIGTVLLATLREIYDGSYTRQLGTSGGRTFAWRGKAGLIGAVTEIIDLYAAKIGALGERFVLVRMPNLDDGDRLALGTTAITNSGHQPEMRVELASAVAGFFEHLRPPEHAPAIDDTGRMVLLADFAARARSAVERDPGWNHEVRHVPQLELSPRIQAGLCQLWGGLIVIGVDQPTAWTVVTRAALDSVSKNRMAVIRALIGKAGRMVGAEDLVDDLGSPTGGIMRTLEDLAFHGLVTRDSRQYDADPLWRASDWTVERWSRL
jgi:hypothetical protein